MFNEYLPIIFLRPKNNNEIFINSVTTEVMKEKVTDKKFISLCQPYSRRTLHIHFIRV